MSEVRQSELEVVISGLIGHLLRIEYKKFLVNMRIVRLVQLSLNNRRDDFGLAYYLVVSAIEAAAQAATNKKKFVQRHLDFES